jgi:hypothetical protein
MANPDRGEVRLEAGDKEYTLVYAVNSMRAFEKETGLNGMAIEPEKISFTVLTALVWALLLEKHKLTMDQAGQVIDAAGFQDTIAAVTNAINLKFGQPVANDGTSKNA